MAQLEVESHDKTIIIQSQAFCAEFQDVGKNKKAWFVFLRSLSSPETGKSLFTYQELADGFGYKARQNIDNFVSEFHAAGDNLVQFLSRKQTKKEQSVPLIEAQILTSPFLSFHQHYLSFCEEHAELKLSEKTFRQYVRELDSLSLLKRVQGLVSHESG